MDVPQNISWDELVTLADQRRRWRQMVHGLKKPPVRGFKTTMTASIVPKISAKTMTATEKYRARDDHTIMFLPKLKQTLKKTRKKKKKKIKIMTNKEKREYWSAREAQEAEARAANSTTTCTIPHNHTTTTTIVHHTTRNGAMGTNTGGGNVHNT